MNAIAKINKEYFNGGELNKYEIEHLGDIPSIAKIEEIVGIDRSNDDWMEACEEIQKWFIDDFQNKYKNIFLVKQTIEDGGYNDKTIKVFDNEKQAVKCSDSYNSKYGNGKTHSYEVEEIEVENYFNY